MNPEENKNPSESPQPAAMGFGPTKPKLVIQPLEGSTLTNPTPAASSTDADTSAVTPPASLVDTTAEQPIATSTDQTSVPQPQAMPETAASQMVSATQEQASEVPSQPPVAPQAITTEPNAVPRPSLDASTAAPPPPPAPTASSAISTPPKSLPYQPAPPVEPVVVQPENPQPMPAPTLETNNQQVVPPTAAPAPPPQAVVGAVLTPEQEAGLAPPKKPVSRKKKLIAIGAPSLVILLGLGGVFGLYLPNTPENVWKTAMSRTNKAVEKVVESVAAIEQLQSYASSEITGEFEADVLGQTYSGKINTRYDEAMSDSGLSVEFPNETGGTNALQASVITSLPKDATLPDVYFKVSGVSALGLDLFVPGISEYEDKWIVASSDYLTSEIGEYMTEAETEEKQPTAADVSEVATAVSDVVRDYMFTTDPDKAVLKNEGFIDKQEVNGEQMFHYKVSIDQANASAMCKAVINAFYKTNAYKSVTGADDSKVAKEITTAQKDCDKDAEAAVKDAGQMEAWVGGKYRLIHKVRVYEPKSTSTYTDIGQNWDGGDEFELFANYVDAKDDTDVAVRLTLNSKTNVTKFIAAYDGGSNGKGSITITAKPLSEKVKVTLPTGAIPVQDIMAAMEAAQEERYSQYYSDFDSSESSTETFTVTDYQEF